MSLSVANKFLREQPPLVTHVPPLPRRTPAMTPLAAALALILLQQRPPLASQTAPVTRRHVNATAWVPPAPAHAPAGPSWSWATVGHMAFTHTCNVSGPWSEAALDVLQKFPMVNIERFMGQHQRCFAKHRRQWGAPGCWLNSTQGSPACDTWVDLGKPGGKHNWAWASAGLKGCNCTVEEAPRGATRDGTGVYVEERAVAALKQLKQRNANMSTIFYHDSGRMWTGDQISSHGRIGPQRSRCVGVGVGAAMWARSPRAQQRTLYAAARHTFFSPAYARRAHQRRTPQPHHHHTRARARTSCRGAIMGAVARGQRPRDRAPFACLVPQCLVPGDWCRNRRDPWRPHRWPVRPPLGQVLEPDRVRGGQCGGG